MVKRGTKQKSFCIHCKHHGHYASTCPLLAQQCLKALSSHNLDALQKHVGVVQKSQKTLKRAAGKRGWNQASKAGGSKKVRKIAVKDAQRKPKKNVQKQPPFNAKNTKQAYRDLVASGWVDETKRCPCGELFTWVPWSTGQQRGPRSLMEEMSQLQQFLALVVFVFLNAESLKINVRSLRFISSEVGKKPSVFRNCQWSECRCTTSSCLPKHGLQLPAFFVRAWGKTGIQQSTLRRASSCGQSVLGGRNQMCSCYTINSKLVR
jgi:hypothetical protein